MTNEDELRRLRERSETGRCNDEPDQIADQESGDESRGPLRAARQRTRNDGCDAGTRRRDSQQVDRREDQQAVNRHDTLRHIPTGSAGAYPIPRYLIAQVPSPVRQARPSDVRDRPSRDACSV